MAFQIDVLLWLMFGSTMVAAVLAPASTFAPPSGLYRIVNSAIWLWTLLLFVVALRNLATLSSLSFRSNALFRLVVPFLVICVFAIPIGLIHGASSLNAVVAYNFVPYAGAIFMFVSGGLPGFPVRLMKVLGHQLPIAALLGFYSVIAHPIRGRGDLTFIHTHAYLLMFPVLLLLPSVFRLDLWSTIGVVGSYAGECVLNIYGENRLATGIFLVLVPLVMVPLWLRAGVKGSRIVAGGAIVALVLVGLWIAVASQSSLSTAWSLTVERMFGTSELSSANSSGFSESMEHEYNDSRGAEALDFISSADLDVWILGDGFGSDWYSTFREESWPMVHFGPLNLVLRGGLIFMFLNLALYFGAFGRAWRWLGIDEFASGALLFVGAQFLGFLSHGPLPTHYGTYVFWMVLGGALGCGGRAVRRVIKRPRPLRPVYSA